MAKKTTSTKKSQQSQKKPRGFAARIAAETKPQLKKRLERYAAKAARWNKVIARLNMKASAVKAILKKAA